MQALFNQIDVCHPTEPFDDLAGATVKLMMLKEMDFHIRVRFVER